MAQKIGHTSYEFGPFHLIPYEGLLRRQDRPVQLTPKALETLLVLVQSSGHLVEKDELLGKVWPDTFVEEATLAQNIFTLRKVLGDTPDGHQYIETVPRRGYRFVAAVTVLGDGIIPSNRTAVETHNPSPGAPLPVTEGVMKEVGRPKAGWLALTLAAAAALTLVLLLLLVLKGWRKGQVEQPAVTPIHSIAVLPLENLSGNSAQDYFADGITESLITDLAQIQGLRVISRTSVMQYKGTTKTLRQIAQELRVDSVVEGAVMRSGDRVRVSAQLVDARTDQHLWANTYDRELRDVLELQRDVAQTVADQVRMKFAAQVRTPLASPRPINPEAYENYLKGRYFWNRRSEEGFKKAIEYFEASLQEDPNYAQAYAGLADAYALLGSIPNKVLLRSEAMPRARTAALKALEIDNSLAEAHTSLAFVRMHYDWDFAGADREFRRAIELNPGYATAHHWYAYYWLAMGSTDKALEEIRLAQESDPLSLIINTDVGDMLFYARRYDEVIEQCRKTLEMDPDFYLAKWRLGGALLEKGQNQEAILQLEKAARMPEAAKWVRNALATAYAKTGQIDKARKILGEMKNESRHDVDLGYDIANLSAALGDKDQAFSWLNKAYRTRTGSLILLKVDPGMDPLRPDPRFRDLMHRVGLPP